MRKADPDKLSPTDYVTLHEAQKYLKLFGLNYSLTTVQRRCQEMGIIVQPGGVGTTLHIRLKYLHIWAVQKKTIEEVKNIMKSYKAVVDAKKKQQRPGRRPNA